LCSTQAYYIFLETYIRGDLTANTNNFIKDFQPTKFSYTVRVPKIFFEPEYLAAASLSQQNLKLFQYCKIRSFLHKIACM